MKVTDLTFSYDENIVLNNLNFEVKKGEMLGIVGESGAGKSTLLRLLGNLIPIQVGAITGQDEIGIIFQNFNLFPHLNVMDNLSLALKVNKVLPANAIQTKAEILLDDFGILDKAYSYIDQLSGGEKQRVAIARALMLEPKILLIDEATSSLDPKRRDDFMEVLNQLKTGGMSIVLVSHDHEIMRAHSDRLIFLEEGEIKRTEILSLNK